MSCRGPQRRHKRRRLGDGTAAKGAPGHLRTDNGPELVAGALRDWCKLSDTATACRRLVLRESRCAARTGQCRPTARIADNHKGEHVHKR